MRLGDLDALKENMMIAFDCGNATKYGNKDAEQQAHSYSTLMLYEISNIVEDCIDNAPTVTNGTYEQGFRVGAYGRLDELRPKGTWEYVQYDANPKIGNWHCSNCRCIPISIDIEHQKTNFCPNCGADMRGKEELQKK